MDANKEEYECCELGCHTYVPALNCTHEQKAEDIKYLKSTCRIKTSPTDPCRCGHPFSAHGWAGPTIGDEWCNGIIMTADAPLECECYAFKQDNLKYLERKYDERRTDSL